MLINIKYPVKLSVALALIIGSTLSACKKTAPLADESTADKTNYEQLSRQIALSIYKSFNGNTNALITNGSARIRTNSTYADYPTNPQCGDVVIFPTKRSTETSGDTTRTKTANRVHTYICNNNWTDEYHLADTVTTLAKANLYKSVNTNIQNYNTRYLSSYIDTLYAVSNGLIAVNNTQMKYNGSNIAIDSVAWTTRYTLNNVIVKRVVDAVAITGGQATFTTSVYHKGNDVDVDGRLEQYTGILYYMGNDIIRVYFQSADAACYYEVNVKTGRVISLNSPNSPCSAPSITPTVTVTTLAGSGVAGNANGIGTAASFNNPQGLAIDAAGNIYVADVANNRICKITQGGVVTTLAGNGRPGYANGTGTSASFYYPRGVAIDATGNVYVADQIFGLIRKITSSGVVNTLAGSGAQGNINGTGTAASFSNPYGVAMDAAGNVYVADQINNLIRKITPAGVVSTFAGSGAQGHANGTGTAASFNYPIGVATDAAGNLYVADWGNNLIRKITSAGVVSTFAGSGVQGHANGTGAAASFLAPQGVATDATGNVYVADSGNNLIRKITPAGVVSTFAGSGAQGNANGSGAAASFYHPVGVATDAAGSVYVAELGNNLIRKITITH